MTRRCLLGLLLLPLVLHPLLAAERRVPLTALLPASAVQGWGSLGTDRSVQGNLMRIAGRTFDHGLGTHAISRIDYDLEEPCDAFEAWVGVDDEMTGHTESSIVFQVLVDAKPVYDSGVMHLTTPAKHVSVPLKGAITLSLIVTDAGDGINCDHADWADAVLIASGPPPAAAEAVTHEELTRLTAAGITFRFGDDGSLLDATAADGMRWFGGGRLRLPGLHQGATLWEPRDGGVTFYSDWRDADGTRRCHVRSTFTPQGDGSPGSALRWDVVLSGDSQPFSVPLVTELAATEADGRAFWTAWSDPDQRSDGWHDPLSWRPFRDLNLTYGNLSNSIPVSGDYFALPLATVAAPGLDRAISVVAAPDDVILRLSLQTSTEGRLRLTRTGHRLGDRTVHFTQFLVPHEADWRGGLRWLVDHYRPYFDSPNPAAKAMGGCGAYSSHEGALDLPKLRRMAFSVNWKASFDFPFMGMFLGLTDNPTTKWRRFDADSGGGPVAGRETWTSLGQMAAYSTQMKRDGFHVLNYFNVTEFGAYLKGPEAVQKELAPADAWHDATTFLYTKVADGILPPTATGGTYGTWGGAVAMDPGGPKYQAFLLDQVQRHLRYLPDSSGFCIDRMDWLRLSNPRADDGLTWIDGQPARSLVRSWHDWMSKMGPAVHGAGKVIFVNPIYRRLDLLRQVDGIYDEMGDSPCSANTTALVALRKPAICWTAHENVLKGDPDAYFQRHLYLGEFPTAPYPANDHTINPSAWADRQYLDYGPLLACLRGRLWVLTPHAVEADGAKANLFAVRSGWVVPVTFAGKAKTVTVQVRADLPAALRWECLQPGSETPVPIAASWRDGVWWLTVPVVRGCAIVRSTVLPR